MDTSTPFTHPPDDYAMPQLRKQVADQAKRIALLEKDAGKAWDEVERLRAELKSADKLISHLNRQALKGVEK